MPPQISLLSTADLAAFKELVAIFEAVFEMENFVCPHDAHLSALLGRDTFMAVVARADGRVVGGLTVYVLHQYYAVKPLAYLYDLAVLASHQRQGIGRQLMDFAVRHCKSLGFEELFVQADREDVHAVDFYRATQPATAGEEVVHFYYML